MTDDDKDWQRWLASDPACWSWPIPDPRPVEGWTPPKRLINSIVAGQRLLDFQAGRCGICGTTLGVDVEDHCHRTGLTRGFLCRGCNTREGLHRGGDDIFSRYRGRPPTVILGHAEQYFDDWGNEYGAKAQDWVVEALGPVPRDPSEAARYLTMAARIEQDLDQNNPLRTMLR